MSSEENLCCPACHGIFQEPIILECSHSFCKACWECRCVYNLTPSCPLCKRVSQVREPPLNLALKNLIESYLLERSGRSSKDTAVLCSLHSEKLGLFCLDHQQPICVVCSHSKLHVNHSFSPIDEAADDCRNALQEQLKNLQEGQKQLTEKKTHCDQTMLAVEAQAQDIEKQIKDVFSQLKTFLDQEEQTRLTAVRKELHVRNEQTHRKSEALRQELTVLSGAITSAEKLLDSESVQFLLSYKATAEQADMSLPQADGLASGGLIDVDEHVTNLAFIVSDRMKDMVEQSFYYIPEIKTATNLTANETLGTQDAGAVSSSQTATSPTRGSLPAPPPPHLPPAISEHTPPLSPQSSENIVRASRPFSYTQQPLSFPQSSPIYDRVHEDTNSKPSSEIYEPPPFVHYVNLDEYRKPKLPPKPCSNKSTKKRSFFPWKS